MNPELPAMVEREAPGCPGVWKKTGGGDLERRADPIPARIAARMAA
jgi:hypothetical protein